MLRKIGTIWNGMMEVLQMEGPTPPSEYEPVAQTALATEHIGNLGRMISQSKSGYSRQRPGGRPVFNANVCTRSAGKIWFGDLDLNTDDSDHLERLATVLKEDVYVLREFDARFENEQEPLFDRAVQVFKT
jgi:hypothetical protein